MCWVQLVLFMLWKQYMALFPALKSFMPAKILGPISKCLLPMQNTTPGKGTIDNAPLFRIVMEMLNAGVVIPRSLWYKVTCQPFHLFPLSFFPLL